MLRIALTRFVAADLNEPMIALREREWGPRGRLGCDAGIDWGDACVAATSYAAHAMMIIPCRWLGMITNSSNSIFG